MFADRILVFGLIGVVGLVGVAGLANVTLDAEGAIPDAPTLALPAPTEVVDVEIRQRRHHGTFVDPDLRRWLQSGGFICLHHSDTDQSLANARARREGLISVAPEVMDAR